MKRRSAKTQEMIGWAVDQGEPVPEWLQRQIAATDALREFHEASIQLATTLQSQAHQWVGEHESVNRSCNVVPTPAATRHDVLDPSKRSKLKLIDPGFVALGRGRRNLAIVLAASAASILIALSYLIWPTGTGQQTATVWVPDQRDSIVTDGSFSNQHASGKQVVEHGVQGLEDPTSDFSSTRSSANSSDHSAALSGSGTTATDSKPPGMTSEEMELYVRATLESTFATLRLVGATLSENAVGQPLERTIQYGRGQQQENLEDAREGVQAVLDASQIELIRDFKRTADFLVQTFPKQASRALIGDGHAETGSP